MIFILWQLSLNHPQTIQIYFGRPEGLRISKGDFVPCGTDRHGHLHLVPHTDKGRALISNRQPSRYTFSCSPPSRFNRSRYPRNILLFSRLYGKIFGIPSCSSYSKVGFLLNEIKQRKIMYHLVSLPLLRASLCFNVMSQIVTRILRSSSNRESSSTRAVYLVRPGNILLEWWRYSCRYSSR